MAKYLSPLVVLTELYAAGRASGSGSDVAATTLVTTPNDPDWDGALYEADVQVQIKTAAGGAETLAVAIKATSTPSGGSAAARTLVVPFTTEAGAVAATADANAAAGVTFYGRVQFRADKNTNIQYTLTHSAANAGAYDLLITIRRVR